MAEDMVRPVCPCHGVPMQKNGNSTRARNRGEFRQDWRCRVANQQRCYDDYHNMTPEQRMRRSLNISLAKLTYNIKLREERIAAL